MAMAPNEAPSFRLPQDLPLEDTLRRVYVKVTDRDGKLVRLEKEDWNDVFGKSYYGKVISHRYSAKHQHMFVEFEDELGADIFAYAFPPNDLKVNWGYPKKYDIWEAAAVRPAVYCGNSSRKLHKILLKRFSDLGFSGRAPFNIFRREEGGFFVKFTVAEEIWRYSTRRDNLLRRALMSEKKASDKETLTNAQCNLSIFCYVALHFNGPRML